MTDALLVGLITSVPVLAGAGIGYRLGARHALAWTGRALLIWGASALVAALGLRLGWYWPAGLITPIALGLLTAFLLSWLLRHHSTGSRPWNRPSLLLSMPGAGLGAILGFVIAVTGWQIALLLVSITTPLPLAEASDEEHQPAVAKQSSLASLAEIAHQGFIQHLPVAGPMTDDILAVSTILKTPRTVRVEFAQYKEWDALAQLPSFQAIAKDESLFAEIDAALAGNLAALYRLQKHPLIVDFYNEDALQEIIVNLKAQQIASELLDFQKQVEGLSTHP